MNLNAVLQSVGLLILRLGFGGVMLVMHGLTKAQNFRELAPKFNPIGLGGTLSLSLAIFAEVVCAGLLVIGLATRLASIPLMVTMLVAIFVVHAEDPWQRKELAVMYLTAYTSLLITGGGMFSLDRFVPSFWKRSKKA